MYTAIPSSYTAKRRARRFGHYHTNSHTSIRAVRVRDLISASLHAPRTADGRGRQTSCSFSRSVTPRARVRCTVHVAPSPRRPRPGDRSRRVAPPARRVRARRPAGAPPRRVPRGGRGADIAPVRKNITRRLSVLGARPAPLQAVRARLVVEAPRRYLTEAPYGSHGVAAAGGTVY